MYISFLYSPSSSSPNPRMCPINMEPQEPKEPRHRAFSCHCSSGSDVDVDVFWRIRRFLRQHSTKGKGHVSRRLLWPADDLLQNNDYKRCRISDTFRHSSVVLIVSTTGRRLFSSPWFTDPSSFSTPCLTRCYLRPVLLVSKQTSCWSHQLATTICLKL